MCSGTRVDANSGRKSTRVCETGIGFEVCPMPVSKSNPFPSQLVPFKSSDQPYLSHTKRLVFDIKIRPVHGLPDPIAFFTDNLITHIVERLHDACTVIVRTYVTRRVKSGTVSHPMKRSCVVWMHTRRWRICRNCCPIPCHIGSLCVFLLHCLCRRMRHGCFPFTKKPPFSSTIVTDGCQRTSSTHRWYHNTTESVTKMFCMIDWLLIKMSNRGCVGSLVGAR